MKNILKLLIAAVAVFFYSACNKVGDLPSYGNGEAVQLSSSVSAVAAAPADSLSTVVNFTWTNPKYAQDSSLYKFIVEIDSTGRNFAKEVTKTVTGAFSTSMTAKELNTILLGFGFSFNTQYTIDVKVTSSYGNNNEKYTSNTIQLQVTPYKIPPKIVPPAQLFIVGSATGGSWNNPVPVPTQELSKVDETTFVGVFDLSGNNQYLLLPVNGDWSHKYSIVDPSSPAEGGDFAYDAPNNFNGPAAGGTYKIIVDFQTGKYTLIPYTGPPVPANLYIVGSATPGSWNNPVPVPSQQFTRLNSTQYQLASITLSAANQYLLLPVNGDWSHKYSVLPGYPYGPLDGYVGYDFSDNIPGPVDAGNYKIDLNFGLQDPGFPGGQVAKIHLTKL